MQCTLTRSLTHIRLVQNVGGMAQTNAEGVVPAKTYTPVAKAATNVLMSVSSPVSADSVGLTAGTMYILMANVAISGSPRYAGIRPIKL